MRRIFLLQLFFFSFSIVHGQEFSNKGKDFYLCFPSHVPSSAGGSPSFAEMSLFITSDKNSSGVVTYNGVTTNFTVTANSVTEIPINRAAAYISDAESNAPVAKGIRVRTNPGQPAVVVYSHIYAGFRTAATLILPTNVLGKKYKTISYYQVSTGGSKSQFEIIAIEPATTVEIQLRKNGVLTGTPYQVTLPNAGDVYQVQDDLDLSGSTIESVSTSTNTCKKIAVFSGSSSVSIRRTGCTNGTASFDPLNQQCYPTSSWGKSFGVIPIVNNNNGYLVRVLANEDNTTVNFNGTNITLNAGQVYPSPAEFVTAQTTPIFINADKPISVSQYLMSQACAATNPIGDPDMIILNPIEQNISNITIFTSSKQSILQQHMNVFIKTVAAPSFKINGTPLPAGSFVTMPGNPVYSYLQYTFPNVGSNSYTLTADSGFNAICYGLGNAESYGYSAGTNVKDLYQQVSVASQYAVESSPTACQGSPFKFKISLPYQPVSMLWDFNGQQTPSTVTINNPVADSTTFINGKQVWWYSLPTYNSYPNVGTFPVTITTTSANIDGCGSTQDIDFDLEVSTPPVASFNWTHNGCITDSVAFQDLTTTTKPTYSWYWDFGDGTTSNLKNPKHKYLAPGTYTVKFATITTPGCLSDTIRKNITVTLTPTAKFGISNPLCEGKPVVFSDTSNASAPGFLQKWIWDYGDGVKDTLLSGTDHSHIYANWGTKTVILKVQTNSGCESAAFPKTFVVHPNPIASFNLPAAVCLPYSLARFTDNSTIADGTQSTFSWLWNFGEPSSGASNSSVIQNPTHLYSGSGPFTITLKVTSANGCTDDSVQTLSTVYLQATSAFTVLPENCLNAVTSFTSNATGSGNTITNWYWDFGDGSAQGTGANSTHTYTAAGTYIVKHWVKTDKGCFSDTTQHTVVVHPLPVAAFTNTSPSCAGKAVRFTDNSTPGAGNIIKWTWNFGDGNPDSVVNNGSPFDHLYNLTGNYDVKLSIETDKGCKTTAPLIKTITVSPLPQPGFVLPEVCLSDAFANFIDTSSIISGSITNWVWDFGDPSSGLLNSSTVKNAQHKYNAVGVYTATLTVTSNLGCVSSLSQSFTVNGDIPVANFITPATSVCGNDTVSITEASTVNFGNVTKVEIYWDYTGAPTVFDKDDFPVPGKVYKHKYNVFQTPATKTFTIRYLAYSGATCVNVRTKTVTINAVPKVQFGAIPDICLDAVPYQITQASETGGVAGPPGGSFSGPGVSNSGLFTPSTVGPGIYTIKYTYTSNAGCFDTVSSSIRVLTPPVADFTVGNPACENRVISFKDASSSSVGTLVGWSWDFGDGTPVVTASTNADQSHQFPGAGNYQVKLTVTTSNGCTIFARKNVLVAPAPRPAFSFPATACLPDAVIAFTNQSTIADGTQNAFTYFWDFGDPSGTNNTSLAAAPSHTYTSVGPFNVKLQVTSNAGCVKDTTIQLNTIHPQPIAAFQADQASICANQSVRFIDNSNGADGILNGWKWDFGDNDVSLVQSPASHIYPVAGVYTVSLQVQNSFGCRDTAYNQFQVYAYPVVDAGPDKYVLEGGEVMLTPVVSGNGLQYLWSPSDYLSNNTIQRPFVRNLVSDITYMLTVTGDGGCQASDSVFVKLLKFPVIPNTFTPNNDGINDYWTIEYLNTYPKNRVQVFNRYGQLVFESRGYAQPWDGTYKGKSLPIGTYYFVIEPGSGRDPITGYVTILK